MTESDGMDEALEGQLRVAVTVAARAGERLARMREQSRREAQHRSEEETRRLQSRLAAERQAAMASYGQVEREEWWRQATPEQITRAYTDAVAWAGEEPQAAAAQRRIHEELRTRYGVEVGQGGDPARVEEAMRRHQQEADRAHHARDDHEAAQRRDRAEALGWMAQANRDEAAATQARAAAEHETEPAERAAAMAEVVEQEARAEHAQHRGQVAYDSAERREGMANDLHARGIGSEQVATRLRADVSQAKHPKHAVAGHRAVRARARREVAAGRGARLQR